MRWKSIQNMTTTFPQNLEKLRSIRRVDLHIFSLEIHEKKPQIRLHFSHPRFYHAPTQMRKKQDLISPHIQKKLIRHKHTLFDCFNHFLAFPELQKHAGTNSVIIIMNIRFCSSFFNSSNQFSSSFMARENKTKKYHSIIYN